MNTPEIKKFSLMEIVSKEDAGKILIKYEGTDWDPENTGMEALEGESIFVIIGREIEKVLSTMPDEEMLILRETTNIGEFFNLGIGMMEEEKVEEIFKGFEVYKVQ